MKRMTKFVAVPIVMGLLLLATAVPAFAHGPANMGLSIALNNVQQIVTEEEGTGANPPLNTEILPGTPGAGTHTAVGMIVGRNPAQDLLDHE